MHFNTSELHNIPHCAGVYQYYDKDKNLLYIGKAKNLFKRVNSYFLNKNLPAKTLRMVEQIECINVTFTHSETEALVLENHLIRAQNPKYNIIFRDDKSYPYLRISGHKFPRLSIFRGKNTDNSILFGPYPNTYSLRDSIQMLQRIFKLRTCEDTAFKNRAKPCLLFQIKRCTAPCVSLISEEDYNQEVQKSVEFLKGNHKNLFIDLEQKMNLYAKNLEYERAGIIRDQIKALSDLFKQQSIDIGKNINLDVIGVDTQYNKICIAVGVVRMGRHLGYKTFIQNLPIGDVDIDINSEEGEKIYQNQKYVSKSEFSIIKAYLEQNNIYLDNKIHNLKILCSLSQENWQEIHEFLPKLKSYKLQTDYTKSWLDGAYQNAKLTLSNFFNSQLHIKKQTVALKELLGLETINPHIECLDISHTSGDYTKAGCVVFKDYTFDRKNFRHYNIALHQKADDYEAMRQALFKRYKETKLEELPHVILIDGGLGQINIAIEVFKHLNLPIERIIGISKGDKRKVGLETLVFADKRPSITPSLSELGLVLLTNIRDMAHDYAVLNMRKTRAKVQVKSILEEIDGIGVIKKKRLIASFGGVQGIAQATIHELMQVHGINQALAEKIYYHFHSQ